MTDARRRASGLRGRHGSEVSAIRFPVVVFAFVVDRLRRLPVVGQLEKHSALVASVLFLAALLALGAWLSQRSPQRVTMADLVAGNLSSLQSWIIVSGDLQPAAAASGNGLRYNLTDPQVPDATLTVFSNAPLATGPTTVSGTLVGGRQAASPGFAWVGQMRADPSVAQEPGPPWLAGSLAGLAALVVIAGRTPYPVFFGDGPVLPATVASPKPRSLKVRVRAERELSDGQAVDGVLRLNGEGAVELRTPDFGRQQLRLHSARTSLEVGELRSLNMSQPALVVRPSTGELTISFTATDERDAAVAALVADAEGGATD